MRVVIPPPTLEQVFDRQSRVMIECDHLVKDNESVAGVSPVGGLRLRLISASRSLECIAVIMWQVPEPVGA